MIRCRHGYVTCQVCDYDRNYYASETNRAALTGADIAQGIPTPRPRVRPNMCGVPAERAEPIRGTEPDPVSAPAVATPSVFRQHRWVAPDGEPRAVPLENACNWRLCPPCRAALYDGAGWRAENFADADVHACVADSGIIAIAKQRRKARSLRERAVSR